ncbi:beta subunit of farnesyltransferase [Aspergillus oryzae 100-8]|uniref:Protein farnesyltransferase subunit beta n=1 Tax=Aspergillus oryzae (strain 3.042) TaxID=1160506 RepID=I8U260_ASPO3|nr:beta subunit of farnesyltransferase [Aspergillus oryzae 3.042]KDE79121.1 beta subunit of farnesyltransferase [Aspergillus oryzae 100-8]|eukprot:EIT80880.1 beta subunit of farnesyltransferase [Aspergillus oryzae 3.042]
MPVTSATGKQRRKVRFASTSQISAGKSSITPNQPAGSRPSSTTLSQDHTLPKQQSKMSETQVHPAVPALFKELPIIQDALTTETTNLQEETVNKCLPFLKGIHSSQKGPFNQFGVPALNRDDHIAYLYDSLEDYPGSFVALDASRPWMVYWALAGLALLGEDISQFRERVITSFRPMQNPTGGFGGGHGQLSHCAPTYAAVLSLAMVGGEEAFQLIDRKAMWRWLGRLKQPDGGFRVSEGGEEDVRGAYCAMVLLSLLDLPLTLPPDAEARKHGFETFTSGLSDYLSRCQTFEGGISGNPGSEAHGAYAFCALACLCILGEPEATISRCVDVPMLLSWLSARQYAPEGGFAGRTNKLVDGCYSFWVGGCWPLIQSAINGTQPATAPKQTSTGNLYSREGLTRYILACCQGKHGGLRDKPGKHPDSYHTCYTLTGLSTTQYYHYHTDASASSRGNFSSAFSWKSLPVTSSDNQGSDLSVFDEKDRLAALHPLYVIPHQAAENMRIWYENAPLEV